MLVIKNIEKNYYYFSSRVSAITYMNEWLSGSKMLPEKNLYSIMS